MEIYCGFKSIIFKDSHEASKRKGRRLVESGLEIKCPRTCPQKSIIEYHVPNLKYVELSDSGMYYLKENTSYYTQCQYLMYCTGFEEVDFVVYSPKEGKSSDPDVNVRLAQAIEQAKRAQMPAQTIKNALKHGEDNKTVDVLWTLELKGPGGCAIVVSLNTDNFSRSKQDINATIRKSNIGVAPGSVSHLFTCKGVIQTQPLQNATFDDTLNDAICMNVEEVEEINEDEERYLQFTCDALHLKGVTKQLEEKNYIVMSAEIEYLPKTLIVLNSEVLKNVRNFYQRLENNPHVVNIFDNITWED